MPLSFFSLFRLNLANVFLLKIAHFLLQIEIKTQSILPETLKKQQ